MSCLLLPSGIIGASTRDCLGREAHIPSFESKKQLDSINLAVLDVPNKNANVYIRTFTFGKVA